MDFTVPSAAEYERFEVRFSLELFSDLNNVQCKT